MSADWKFVKTQRFVKTQSVPYQKWQVLGREDRPLVFHSKPMNYSVQQSKPMKYSMDGNYHFMPEAWTTQDLPDREQEEVKDASPLSHVRVMMSEHFAEWAHAWGLLFRHKDGRSLQFELHGAGEWQCLRLDSAGDDVGASVRSFDFSESGMWSHVNELLKVSPGTRLVYKAVVQEQTPSPEQQLRAAMRKQHGAFRLDHISFRGQDFDADYERPADSTILCVCFVNNHWSMSLTRGTEDDDDAWSYQRNCASLQEMMDLVCKVLTL